MRPSKALELYGPAEIAHGPLFVGFFFNVLLCGIMVIQTYSYFKTFRRPSKATETEGCSALGNDIMSSADSGIPCFPLSPAFPATRLYHW
ncbi:hypothetical protein B0H15DRAFT_944625 [Mycena belliarum]|uniref:Uncharacterized protein n=1 Tax=Mycena belliarum TaxID=1033014 RepID=A0AAD6UFA4_9AGAR|nr:hypothetical protein B0H15DRAFT_944625 [Mycena belliae]